MHPANREKQEFKRLIAAVAVGLGLSSSLKSQVLELSSLGARGLVIDGLVRDDFLGDQVSGAGDVNGDGLGDLIIAAGLANPNGNFNAGEAYVLFGQTGLAPFDLTMLQGRGFQINGATADDDGIIGAVSGAGDVNGDGLDDLIVGATDLDGNGNPAGQAYVIFGKTDSAVVEFSSFGSQGFRINMAASGSSFGAAVSGAGDVNGDGLADVVIGARTDDFVANNAGRSFVVFGKRNSNDVDLRLLDGAGFAINGASAEDHTGDAVSGIGDFNGDGIDDLIIGAVYSSITGEESGRAYVVFGSQTPTDLDLGDDLGGRGVVINGGAFRDRFGKVCGAGDVNGDGLADVIVGAFRADPGGRASAGKSYVLFGKSDTTTIEASALGDGGFVIEGVDPNDWSGFAVAGAGDVNGDGMADVLTGAFRADPAGRTDAGEVYLIHGKTNTTTVALGFLPQFALQINGAVQSDSAGRSLSGAGDFNGDGLSDFIVGAQAADGNALNSGQAYLILGTGPASSGTYRARAPAGSTALRGVGLTGDGSDASTAASRAAIGFAAGTGAGPAQSSLQTILRRTDLNPELPRGSIGTVWEISTDRQSFQRAELALRYLANEVAPFDVNALAIYRASTARGPWTELITRRDTRRGQLSAVVSRFGYFAIGPTSRTIRDVPPPIGADAGDRLGASVAADGRRLAVGVPRGGTGSEGQVVIYRVEGEDLIEDEVIAAPASMLGLFGGAVAMDGNRLLVGAGPETIGAARRKQIASLQAALFERINTEWTLVKNITSQAGSSDAFGTAVAIEGDLLVVGAPGDNGGMGAAYFFDANSNSMIKTDPPPGGSGDFGSSVAASGGTVAIGAPGSVIDNAIAGSMTLYDQIAVNLGIIQTGPTVGPPNPQSGDAFGAAIDLDGDQVVIGAPGESIGTGAAYVYDVLSDGISSLAPDDLEAAAGFGQSVAISGSGVLVGAPDQQESGVVFSFDPALINSELVPAGDNGLAFGQSVDLTGEGIAIIGAPATNQDAGAATVLIDVSMVFIDGFEP